MSDEEFKSIVLRRFDTIDDNIETLKRGVYGDQPNQTPGALSRIAMLEQKVKKLFSDRKKVIWVGSTAIVVVGALFKVLELLLK